MSIINYRQALNQALREEMKRDPDVFLIGEEVAQYQGAYRVTEGMLEEFGENRVKDTPISELVLAGMGVGAAMAGLRPVVEMMTVNFAVLALDQIVNHAAKLLYMSGGQVKVPMVIRAPEGAGMQLGAQHSQNLEAWFTHIPGLKVAATSTPYNAKGLLKASIRDNNPVIFIEHELLYGVRGEVPDDDYTVPLGQAERAREGTDVTIISYLRMRHVALKAAEQLESQGIKAEVIDLQSLRPMDTGAIVQSVRKTHHVVIVEEDWPQCGIGAQVIDQIQLHCFDYLDSPILRVTLVDTPMPYSRDLEQSALPDEGKVVDTVHRVLMGSAQSQRPAASI